MRISSGSIRADRAQVGTLSLPVAGVQLQAGGAVRARLHLASAGEQPVSLLITLATAPEDYGEPQVYRVRVDGRELYRAEERDPGGGVHRSFFVELPSHRRTAEVEILADPTTPTPITVAAIRAYTGLLPAKRGGEETQRPTPNALKVALALLTSQGHGYQIDVGEMRALMEKIPRSPYLIPQTATLYNFCVRNAAENAQEIARLADLAEQTGIPLRIAFQMHWGGIPRGVSDGAGGSFSDLPYQQITYDPDDRVDEPGLAALMGDRYDTRYGLSVPNIWNDTPWLTFNHPRLNQLRRVRLTQALAAWLRERERLEARGKARLLPPEISTGEETVYWAKGVEDRGYTQINGGRPRANLMADFNPFVVRDALLEGVNLDPRDGLTPRERMWLHQNLARWQQTIIDWMFAALPADPIKVTEGKSAFATDLLRRNLYTEPYAMPLYPMKDISPYHPGLEVGYVRNGRSGGEYWSGATMLPWLLKERERGRIALPNLECTGANDEQLVACLRAAYACGARFMTLYNWHYRQNITDLLRAFARSIEVPAGMAFEPVIAASDPPTERTREYIAPSGAFGINRIQLFPKDTLKPIPIRLRLRDAERRRIQEIRVTALLSADPILLPTLFHQEPGRKYILTIEAPEHVGLDLLPAEDGRFAVRLTADIALERMRSRVIADWQDAVDLIESVRLFHPVASQTLFSRQALEDAENHLAQNRPQEAYRAAIRAEQLSLPATFQLPQGGGRLAPYWVTVLCPDGPVQATIRVYAKTTAVISLRSGVPQTVTLRWGTSETTATLSPDIAAEISLVTRRRPRRYLPRRRTLSAPALRPPKPSVPRP